jgi:hypothetical protein
MGFNGLNEMYKRGFLGNEILCLGGQLGYSEARVPLHFFGIIVLVGYLETAVGDAMRLRTQP